MSCTVFRVLDFKLVEKEGKNTDANKSPPSDPPIEKDPSTRMYSTVPVVSNCLVCHRRPSVVEEEFRSCFPNNKK